MATMQFSTFFLGENLFGLPVMIIREINRNVDITAVDRAPDYVRGLLNLRGQIVTVLDMGVRLGIGERTITPKTKIIILKTAEEISRHTNEFELTDMGTDSIGLLVDSISDMVTIESDEIEPPPANIGGIDGKFTTGVVKLERNLLVLLKPEEVVGQEKA